VIIIVALGIGANTAVFSLMYAVMVRSLPVWKPAQLYRIGNQPMCCVQSVFPNLPGNWGLFSNALYAQFRDELKGFDELAAFQAAATDLNIRSGPDRRPQHSLGEFVSGNYFAMFGVNAVEGRAISSADDRAGSEPVAMMSYRLWQQNYSRDRSIIGKVFTINNVRVSIIGIAPAGFFGDTLRENPPDFWMPLSIEPSLRPQNSLLNQAHVNWLYLMGRLHANTHPSTVSAQATLVLQEWLSSQTGLSENERNQISRQTVRLIEGGHGIIARLQSQYSEGLVLLTWISGFVLLITCANIACLFLARFPQSRAQLSVSLALGASRSQLFGQVLTESLMLAILGGISALGFAYAGARLLIAVASRGVDYIPVTARPSLAILGFTFLLALLTGLLFGSVPAWSASRLNPIEALRDVQRSTAAQSALPQQFLVVVQIAVSLMLLVLSGLSGLALRNLESQQFGFQTADRWLVNFNPELAGYTTDRLETLYSRIRERLGSVPGVRNVSISTYVPMSGYQWDDDVYVEGEQSAGTKTDRDASWNRITPSYFGTIGTPMIKGRTVLDQDTPTSIHVAVVNQAFATKFFGETANPIGRHFGIESVQNSNAYEIVGVVADAKYWKTDRPIPMFFLPFLQLTPYSDPTLSRVDIRSNYAHNVELYIPGGPQALGLAVRRAFAEIDPDLSVLELHSFDEQVQRYFNHERIMARLTSALGLLALILASLGVYGVTAYAVSRRTSEIGLRLALGANRQRILKLVMRGTLVQTAAGLLIGVPLAFAAAKTLSSQLYGISSYDPAVFSSAAALLVFFSFLAALLPAARAITVDPVAALRYE
jgi:predicted permease